MSTDQGRTKAAYDLQWNRFRIVRPEEDRATFLSRTGMAPDDFQDKVVLDAGCGMGRYLRVAAGLDPRLLVGVDLSGAVRAARDATAGLPNVAIVQGDLLRPPFADGCFDLIYSLGVMDHTPDPKAAFFALARLLAPGGRIVVWVYQKERALLEWIKNSQRAISTRMPLPILVGLCRMTAPIGGLKRRLMASRFRPVERAGVALHLLTLGVSMHPDPEVRVCDTLDWYAPRYMSRHTCDEVRGWYSEAGLVDVVDLTRGQAFYHEGQGHGVNLIGRRPGPITPASTNRTEKTTS
jgi:SAM-dependent methyltransferase